MTAEIVCERAANCSTLGGGKGRVSWLTMLYNL